MSEASQAAGGAFIKKLMQRNQDREPISGPAVAHAQMAAIRDWEQVSGERFSDLKKIHHQTLVVNGVSDEMIPVSNSYWLSAHLPNVVLLTYPDSGHGSLFQFHESFTRQAAAFLTSNSPIAPCSKVSSTPDTFRIGDAPGEHAMPADTHETAPNQFVRAGEVQFAYRRFGPRRGTPLVLFNYLAANMDDWDPKVTNGLAAEHDVIIFDYSGVGKSSSETPSTVAALTKHCAAFCRAIGPDPVRYRRLLARGHDRAATAAERPDLLGRTDAPRDGAGRRGGEGMDVGPRAFRRRALERRALLIELYRSAPERGGPRRRGAPLRAAAEDGAARTVIEQVTERSTAAEIAAIREWGVIPASDRFAMLSKIHHPTLIVHGNKDVVVMPINAFLLAEHLPNAQLIMYPDASHGAQSQHAEVFLQHVKLFLQ